MTKPPGTLSACSRARPLSVSRTPILPAGPTIPRARRSAVRVLPLRGPPNNWINSCAPARVAGAMFKMLVLAIGGILRGRRKLIRGGLCHLTVDRHHPLRGGIDELASLGAILELVDRPRRQSDAERA